MDWNRAIQILNQFSNTKSKGIPPNLICIVQTMEGKAEVKIGGLMERTFELEELHRPVVLTSNLTQAEEVRHGVRKHGLVSVLLMPF
jgi:hypothetical protein